MYLFASWMSHPQKSRLENSRLHSTVHQQPGNHRYMHKGCDLICALWHFSPHLLKRTIDSKISPHHFRIKYRSLSGPLSLLNPLRQWLRSPTAATRSEDAFSIPHCIIWGTFLVHNLTRRWLEYIFNVLSHTSRLSGSSLVALLPRSLLLDLFASLSSFRSYSIDYHVRISHFTHTL